MRHELVAQQQKGGVEQRLERGGTALVLLLPREAQQVLHDVAGPLGLLLDDAQRLPQRRRHAGDFGEVVGEPDHRGQRVVEVVGDAGDELADGGHLFRLDELVLQSTPFRLIIEEEHDGGAVSAVNRHHGNRIGPIAGAEVDLAARSLLLQCPLQIRSPFGWNEGLPGPADQAGGRGVDQVGEGPVGPADPAAAVHDAKRGRDGVHHLLPGATAVVMEVHQAGALQRDARLRGQTLQQGQITGGVAARLTAHRHRAGYSGLGDQRDDQPAAPRRRLRRDGALVHQRIEAVGQQQRAAAGGEVEEGAPVGTAAGPLVHRRQLVDVPMIEADGDLGRGEGLADVAQQGIHHRRTAKGARQLLAEHGETAHQRQLDGRVRLGRGRS